MFDTTAEYPRHGTTSHGSHGEEPGDQVEIGFLAPHFEPVKFPFRQILGFIGSIILTAMAFGLVMRHMLPPVALVSVVLALALLQAGLQLGFFMHIRESRGTSWHILTLGMALFVVIAVVGGSIWLTQFHWGVS